MADQGFSLVPFDEVPLSPDEALEAAISAALDGGAPEDAEGLERSALGRSWLMDPRTGQIVRRGGAAVSVSGAEALRTWIITTVRTARFTYAIFDDSFGLEDPDSGIGEVDPREALASYEERVRDALTEHDRIVDVIDFFAIIDPGLDTVEVSFDIITDAEESLTLSGIRLQFGAF